MPLWKQEKNVPFLQAERVPHHGTQLSKWTWGPADPLNWYPRIVDNLYNGTQQPNLPYSYGVSEDFSHLTSAWWAQLTSLIQREATREVLAFFAFMTAALLLPQRPQYPDLPGANMSGQSTSEAI